MAILAKHAGWGAADNFYRAFTSQGYDTVLLCLKGDKTARTSGENIVNFLNQGNINKWFSEFTSGNRFLFVCSPMIVLQLDKKFGKSFSRIFKSIKRKAIFITGTKYLKEAKYWNSWLNAHNFSIRFSEPEMVRLGNNVPLLHPMEYNLDITKGKIIIVSHAPGMIERDAKKGTSAIRKGLDIAFKEVKFSYDHIVGVPLAECLKRKARSHIFIDQINPYVGGIGKNGLEAISLGCVTMCSINNFSVDNSIYKDHPIINVQSESDVARNVIRLIKDNELPRELKKVDEWKKTIGYKSTVKYIMERIGK